MLSAVASQALAPPSHFHLSIYLLRWLPSAAAAASRPLKTFHSSIAKTTHCRFWLQSNVVPRPRLCVEYNISYDLGVGQRTDLTAYEHFHPPRRLSASEVRPSVRSSRAHGPHQDLWGQKRRGHFPLAPFLTYCLARSLPNNV